MIFIGSDHAGLELKESVKSYLTQQGLKYEDCGTYTSDSCDYAKIARIVGDEVVNSVILFIVLYVVVLLISTLTLAAMGIDLLTGLSASAATMGNAGPGFGLVGSMTNYSNLPDAAIAVLSFDMLLGRLEIFGLIMLFMIKSWK